jgi:hypothetical protein
MSASIHAQAFKCRVSFSLSYRSIERKWRVIKMDGPDSTASSFYDLFDALEWIKDQYRTAGIDLDEQFAAGGFFDV